MTEKKKQGARRLGGGEAGRLGGWEEGKQMAEDGRQKTDDRRRISDGKSREEDHRSQDRGRRSEVGRLIAKKENIIDSANASAYTQKTIHSRLPNCVFIMIPDHSGARSTKRGYKKHMDRLIGH
jgi:hypothetical protein